MQPVDLDSVALTKGAHKRREDGVCAMELVAWIAGEPHSDAPKCACPVLTAFVVRLNDTLDDEPRNRLLKPIVPRLVGTRGDEALAERRSYLALDWLIREATPAWLDLVPSLAEHAATLRALDPIMTLEDAERAGPLVQLAAERSAAARAAAVKAARATVGGTMAAVEDAAWDATGAVRAAVAAAGAASGDAARAAARAPQTAALAAAWAAAWAAVRTAVRAAWAATWAAVRAAAWAAARGVLRPTKEALHVSAVQLVERMIDAPGVSP